MGTETWLGISMQPARSISKIYLYLYNYIPALGPQEKSPPNSLWPIRPSWRQWNDISWQLYLYSLRLALCLTCEFH